ncbi:lumazine synthase [Umbelopsis nana]
MAQFEKGVTASDKELNGSNLRILIVHTRWNLPIVEALVKGAKDTLVSKHKVLPENIVIESVPGAYELPFAAKSLIQSAQTQGSSASEDLLASATDLLGELTASDERKPDSPNPGAKKAKKGAFDAVICVGVLIKGSTMHFEYICEATSQGIMRVGLDTNVPVIFGVLTCLDDEQAQNRAGMIQNGHNHGEDWGSAAVEMALIKNRTL